MAKLVLDTWFVFDDKCEFYHRLKLASIPYNEVSWYAVKYVNVAYRIMLNKLRVMHVLLLLI